METNPVIAADLEQIIKANLPWEHLQGKTVLVTGANGFLPAYMVKTMLLLNDKHNAAINVLALVRNKAKAEDRFANYLSRKDFSVIVADITRPLTIDGKVDIIIHAASQASPKYYATDPVGTLSANTIGTYHLLNLAVEKRAQRFLYFSSSEVYGALTNSDNITEDTYGAIDPTNVRSCYAESKRMGETLCVSFGAQYKIPCVMVRPFHTYGPGLALDDGRVFADFVANIVKGQDIVMNSDGSAVRSFCYLADATVGFFTALLKGEASQAYNVGNPQGALSIKQLAEILVKLYPEKNTKAVFNTGSNSNYMASSFNKLCPSVKKMNDLGWNPSTTVAEGFRRTIDSFLQ